MYLRNKKINYRHIKIANSYHNDTSLHLTVNIYYTLQKNGRRKWKVAQERIKSFVLKCILV
jgi:hypothetical protein